MGFRCKKPLTYNLKNQITFSMSKKKNTEFLRMTKTAAFKPLSIKQSLLTLVTPVTSMQLFICVRNVRTGPKNTPYVIVS